LDLDPYAAYLGIGLVAVDDDSVTVSMPVTENHQNFHSGTHGAALFSVADCAFSLASNAYDQLGGMMWTPSSPSPRRPPAVTC
jgi:acyl-CoA thioesterase